MIRHYHPHLSRLVIMLSAVMCSLCKLNSIVWSTMIAVNSVSPYHMPLIVLETTE